MEFSWLAPLVDVGVGRLRGLLDMADSFVSFDQNISCRRYRTLRSSISLEKNYKYYFDGSLLSSVRVWLSGMDKKIQHLPHHVLIIASTINSLL